jgi:hypothetical protein
MASTNTDRSKIDLAGVDSGAKILVRTVDGSASTAAAAVAKDKNKNAKMRSALSVIDFVLCRICVDRSL